MPGDDHERWPQATSGRELDLTLWTAERLLEDAERTSERQRRARIGEIAVIGLTIFVIASLDALERLAGWPRLMAVSLIGAAVGAGLAATIHLLLENPLRRRQIRDARVAVEMGEQIRELLPLVARTEKWNELQLDVFKSRLSRFPIDPRGVR